ncbi:archaeosortase A [Haloarcula onubensis]|uniref:Archaeosortase A n=1 Tax=Haloarcula onubensis TaxID=2950539 RepID=A0ABU2FR82_9EURY|nr:archaeosortase A [Halomicroarcula sp. S3CR25-11]MDS0282919.1 archaeosortase A [Halomicroarcula sp. S3CR25-11]
MSVPVLQSTISFGGVSFDPLVWSEPLMWVVLAAFLGSAVVSRYDRERARLVAVAGWVAFGAFWLVLIPHFTLTQKSLIEGVGSLAAVPLSVWAGYQLYQGRDSLFVLTRAVGLMGLVYVPFLTIGPLRQALVESVTDQTAFLLSLFGFDPLVVDGFSYQGIEITEKPYPYESTFWFEGNSRPITYNILLACTGMGSISIFAGAILAVDAPWRRRLRALALTVSVIYVLNLFRNVFIAVSFGYQRMQILPGLIMTVFGIEDPQMVSYYVADRILAQTGSVVVLVGITYFLVRELPEITVLVEDLLYLVTGTEYDLAAAFDAGTESEDVATPGDD